MEKYLEKIENSENPSDVDEDEDEETKTGAEMEEMLAQAEIDAKTRETNWDEEETNEATDNNNAQLLTKPQALSQGAKGTRKGQKSQKDVMGFSASQLAERVLKWTPPDQVKTKCKKRQMKNGLYIAEWLHLCAYSWGGLLNDYDDEKNLESSQTVENLVLGTSEANSCLFLDEAHFAEKIEKNGQAVNITGFLGVQRNPKDHKREHDGHTPGGSPEYVWQSVNLFSDNDVLANYVAQAKLLAYTVLYEPSMTAPVGSPYSSLILRRGFSHARELEIFYPFSRRFFHRSEYLLDSALYQAMYTLTANELTKTGKLKKEDATDMIKKRFRFTNEYISGVLKSGKFDPEAVDTNRMQKQKQKHQKTVEATTNKMLYMFTDKKKSESRNTVIRGGGEKGGRRKAGKQGDSPTSWNSGFPGTSPQVSGGHGFNNLNGGNGVNNPNNTFNYMPPQNIGTGNRYNSYYQNTQNRDHFARNNQQDTQNNVPGSEYIQYDGYDMQNGNQFRFNQGNQLMQNNNNNDIFNKGGQPMQSNYNIFNQSGQSTQGNNNVFNQGNRPTQNDFVSQDPGGFNFNQENTNPPFQNNNNNNIINPLFQNNNTNNGQDFQNNTSVNPLPNNWNLNMNLQNGNLPTATKYPSMTGADPNDYTRLLGTIGQTDDADAQVTKGRRRDGRPGIERQGNFGQVDSNRNRDHSFGDIEPLKKMGKLERQDQQQGDRGGQDFGEFE
ncbi:hypothetical protein ABW20_dc0105798 [Dactylellina cionopaga]|nr:hypothetical protein ABW20_dc0105798 [Dactylellina cionopaga]